MKWQDVAYGTIENIALALIYVYLIGGRIPLTALSVVFVIAIGLLFTIAYHYAKVVLGRLIRAIYENMHGK